MSDSRAGQGAQGPVVGLAEPRHGRVTSPKSRAARYLGGDANGLESGKFFPATKGGLKDPDAPQDVANAAPPPDGKIASAGISLASKLDGVKDPSGKDWPRTKVASGKPLTFTWTLTAPHKTRRWNYFITKQNWDPRKPLTRAQFETKPILSKLQDPCEPYWDNQCGAKLTPPSEVKHSVPLPARTGYHVILAVWEVADTARAFYQVIDVEFPTKSTSAGEE
ncbi:lytic polysaccharide monooxygenase [Streptomyces capparidis]